MNEAFPIPTHSETFPVSADHQKRIATMGPLAEHVLRGQTIVIDASSPLMDKDSALKVFGINGNIIATITLPGDAESGIESKDIAIVDYGEPNTDSPQPAFIVDGIPRSYLGKIRERYGLCPLNYSPDTDNRTAALVGFGTGKSIGLGRNIDDLEENSDVNKKLGLVNGTPDNEHISRKHVTISMVDGKLTIVDHSANGSLVRTAIPEQNEPTTSTRELQAEGQKEPGDPDALIRDQQRAQRRYDRIALAAGQLASGTVSPSILVNNIHNLLDRAPKGEQAALKELRELIDGIVDEHGRVIDRYRLGETAQKIQDIIARSQSSGT